MYHIWLYSLVSVVAVSLLSLVGVVTLAFRENVLRRWLFNLVSLSAGALLGDVFLHLLPQMHQTGFGPREGAYILGGILLFFILEKFILWHHSHTGHQEEIHSVVYLTLIGDSLHNFIDGVVIASAFLVSIPLGIATALAVVFHEIPHEFGNFAILVHGGWKTKKALWYNFLSSLPAVVGALAVLGFSRALVRIPTVLLAFAVSSFIYIAMSDLIPELNEESSIKKSLIHLVFFVIGIGLMALLLLAE